jgi:hypothetical protein
MTNAACCCSVVSCQSLTDYSKGTSYGAHDWFWTGGSRPLQLFKYQLTLSWGYFTAGCVMQTDSEYPRHGTVFQMASLIALHICLRSICGVEHCHFSFHTKLCDHVYCTYNVRQTVKLKFEIKHSVANVSCDNGEMSGELSVEQPHLIVILLSKVFRSGSLTF